jgi:arabinose-5-phosphate isomerase
MSTMKNILDPPAPGRSRDIASARHTLSTEVEGLQAVGQHLGGVLGERLSEAIELILERSGRVVVTGMGKSGHVARKIAATLASTGTPSMFLHPAEASHGDLGMVRPEDLVLALSWSGETSELSDVVAYSRRFSVPLVAMTSKATSSLASAADIALVLPPMVEACPNGLAPTTSTTAQLALGDALAICLLERRGFSPDDFRGFHPGGKLGARLKKVRELMHGGDAMPMVHISSPLSAAICAMTSGRFGLTGVTDSTGRLVGVITDGDLRRAFEAGFYDRPIAGVMGGNPRTIRPDALAQDALARMENERITSLFVIEAGKPIGLVHIHDLLRAGLV